VELFIRTKKTRSSLLVLAQTGLMEEESKIVEVGPDEEPLLQHAVAVSP
jgi:hypothetical protein